MATSAEALQTAIDFHQAGQLPQAEQICRRILDSNPWQPVALNLLGVVAHQSGRHELAVQYIGQAIEIRPKQPICHYNLGLAYQALGCSAEARDCYELALRLDPAFTAARDTQRLLNELEPDRETVERLPILCINASHQYRCIFVHVPKNAGSSIKRVLDMPGGNHFSWWDYAEHHSRLWEAYASFAVVRNPWDRVVSAYQYAKMEKSYWQNELTGLHSDYLFLRDKSFEECVSILCHQRDLLEHMSWHSQAWYIADKKSGNKIMVETVLRFESLAEDFAEFRRKLKIDCEPLPMVNTTQRLRDYRTYYNDQTRKMVEQVYRVDVELFGYSF